MRTLTYYGLQPAILIGVLTLWLMYPESPAVYPLLILGTQLLLGVLEHIIPARPDWVQGLKIRFTNITVALFILMGTVFAAEWYAQALAPPLAELRASLNMDIWPHHWPVLVQVFMVFFASEFIWYWVHRAEHRWAIAWRLSGHGAHHSFKNLGAINFGLNHPLELSLLVLPSAIVELFFGVGIAAAGAAALAAVQASIAHANLSMNTKWIGLLFTTNRYHIHHHSIVLEESNTNYGCSAILWDRIFGTFAESDTVETGTGPTEPTLWQKFIMPIKEPQDTAVAPE